MHIQPRGFSSLIVLVLIAVIIAGGAYYYFSASTPITSKSNSDTATSSVSDLHATSTPNPIVLSKPGYGYCPDIDRNLNTGSKDEFVNGPEGAKGQVSNLQAFLVSHYDIKDNSFIDGIYGKNTSSYVERFQKELGFPTNGSVDEQLRANILAICSSPLPTTKTINTLSVETGSHALVLRPGQAFAQPDVDKGGFRIEYVSSSPATIRITGRDMGGINSAVTTLTTGKSELSNNWPVGLQITLNKVETDGALDLEVEELPTD